ncbi:MAG: VPLPA-CTERM sorting domain-containing protein [Pseudomonadota bacterium]
MRLIGTIFALCMALFASAAAAGHFTTSGVTYTTPDFDLSGGFRDVDTPSTALVRFPLVDGASYTVSYQSSNGDNLSVAVYDFVAPEAGSGDPFAFPSNNSVATVLATDNFSQTQSGSVSFNATTNGFGTIELSDFGGGTTVGRITLAITNIPSQVPLPAAGFLLLGGLGAMALARRRKKAVA